MVWIEIYLLTIFKNRLFYSLHELVIDNKNSYIFKSQEELSEKLIEWFEGFPHNNTQKQVETRFKGELNKFQSLRWRENWDKIAYPAFE